MNLPDAIERLRDVLRRQHKAIATEASYVYWLRRNVTALKTMPSSLETTMGYLHAESLSVRSQLESILGGLQPGRKTVLQRGDAMTES